jgi:hypothetical protein
MKLFFLKCKNGFRENILKFTVVRKRNHLQLLTGGQYIPGPGDVKLEERQKSFAGLVEASRAAILSGDRFALRTNVRFAKISA